jgi:hypothetical protein
MEEQIKEELLNKIEHVIKSNDNLFISCENEEEGFELRFQGHNELYIEYTDREVLYQEEGYAENEIEDYNSLESLQEGAIDFIKENNAIDNIQIKRNGILLFSGENFKKMIYHKIKNHRKREIGMHFGKGKKRMNLSVLRSDLKKVLK